MKLCIENNVLITSMHNYSFKYTYKLYVHVRNLSTICVLANHITLIFIDTRQ